MAETAVRLGHSDDGMSVSNKCGERLQSLRNSDPNRLVDLNDESVAIFIWEEESRELEVVEESGVVDDPVEPKICRFSGTFDSSDVGRKGATCVIT